MSVPRHKQAHVSVWPTKFLLILPWLSSSELSEAAFHTDKWLIYFVWQDKSQDKDRYLGKFINFLALAIVSSNRIIINLSSFWILVTLYIIVTVDISNAVLFKIMHPIR